MYIFSSWMINSHDYDFLSHLKIQWKDNYQIQNYLCTAIVSRTTRFCLIFVPINKMRDYGRSPLRIDFGIEKMARLIGIVTIIGLALACVLAQDLYSDRYDDVDVLAVFNNEKLRDQYYQCLMDIGPCRTPDAKFFKGIIGEALRTQCKRCTEKQKLIIENTIDWFTKNRPDLWQEILIKALKAKQITPAGQ